MSANVKSNDGPSFQYSEFKPVSSRKKRKNKRTLEQPPLHALIQHAKNDLKQDSWIVQCQQILRPSLSASDNWKVVCLGLGSPTFSSNARAQLAFLLEICDLSSVDRSRGSVYDPVFTEKDLALFTECQIATAPTFKIGDYVAQTPTLFFMPHCDLELYEDILRVNWHRDRLRRIVFVCNRLGDYVENRASRELEESAPCLTKIVPFLTCKPLPSSRLWPSAFNNIAVQLVDSAVTPPSFPDLEPHLGLSQ